MRNIRQGVRPEVVMEDAGQPALIAVLASDGAIQYVNDAWVRHARRSGVRPDYRFPGENYLAVCRRAAAGGDAYAAAMAAGIQAVLDGEETCFRMNYPCQVPGEGTTWYQAEVRTAPAGMTGVFVTHLKLRPRVMHDSAPQADVLRAPSGRAVLQGV